MQTDVHENREVVIYPRLVYIGEYGDTKRRTINEKTKRSNEQRPTEQIEDV